MMESEEIYKYKKIELKNEEIYGYREIGSSNPEKMVLIHGNLSTSLFFDNFMKLYSSKFHVIAPDLRGFGGTSYKNPIESFKDLAEDLKLFFDALKIENAYVLGWSAGGPVVLEFALLYPELIKKIILVSSIGPKGLPRRDKSGIYRNKQDFENSIELNEVNNHFRAGNYLGITWLFRMAFPKECFEDEARIKKMAIDVSLQKNFMDMMFAISSFNIGKGSNGINEGNENIYKITTPCLLIHGAADQSVSPAESWELKKGMIKTSYLEIVKTGSHMLFELNLKEVSEYINKFLDEN